KRPLCDTVVVNAPETVDYTLQAELVLYTGANAVEVKAAAEQAWAVYENQRRLKLGGDIVPLDVMSVLKVTGVYNVVLTQPNWKIIKPNQWARCTAVKLTTSTERQDG
ncbi:baseplate J/gp47 family protein, partial [Kingella kingae]|nr:baseplate J/gp47 family protein [Kingella kingae]